MNTLATTIAITQLLVQLTTLWFIWRTANLRIISPTPFYIFAMAFAFTMYRRIYTLITLKVLVGKGATIFQFFDALVVPLVGQVLILTGFMLLYQAFYSLKKKFENYDS